MDAQRKPQQVGVARPVSPDVGRPLPPFFHRLSRRAQRCYLQSDAIASYQFTASRSALELTQELVVTLVKGSPAEITEVSGRLASEICRLLGVPALRVEVRGIRPHGARGELHGIFYPREHRRGPRIVLWMRTAARHYVVKPKTFVRTLIHELGHYFDYAALGLDDSFHTSGFFRRESFLMHALYPLEDRARR